MANRNNTEKIDFEQALAELEKIVKQLESGNLPLEKSLELFERGVKLARQCKEKLSEAELKVNKLIEEKEGEMGELPFAEEGD
jgi:exodeoxyribonuclease VII small subunit|uniref:Exodeoxyribonuclease 7 small subunit n=1 Tax=candidate division WOR-3 bacterium TaxID=2052148 RepID=A0A7V3PST4_UNCW3